MRPSLILFDFDEVLAHYSRSQRVNAFAARLGIDAETAHQAIYDSGIESAADRGKFDSHGHAQQLSAWLQRPLSIADMVSSRAAGSTANLAVIALAERIARRYQIAILTNNGHFVREHLPSICPALFPLFNDRVYCAAQFGIEKPDPQVFIECAKVLQTPPEQIVFIDDRPENIAGAMSIGMRGHIYTEVANLHSYLTSLHLLD